jgi:MFS transporter, FHS family, glucose/mannose:H+ symporter
MDVATGPREDAPPRTAMPTPMVGRHPSRRVLAVLAAAYWSYVVNGMVNSEVGPALLGIVHSFHIDLAAAGAIFSAQFVGYLPGALIGGAIADRWGYRRVLIPASMLVAAGTAGIVLVSAWPLALALTAAAGFGFGTTDSLCNAVVAAEAPRSGGAALNLLHMFFGVGALIGPLLVGALLDSPAGWHGVFLITGALACSTTLLFTLVPIPLPAHLTAIGGGRPHTPRAGASEITDGSGWRDSYLWLLAGLLFLFVGIEQLVGGWGSTYLNRVLGAHADVAARSVSLYWAAVTGGRLLASIVALRLSNERLLGGSVALSLIGLLALALAGGVAPALVALGATGVGLAAIYPTLMAITARAYPRRFATLAGVLVAAGGLGGTVFPWLGGVTGQAWGVRATIWLGAGIAGALMILCMVLIRQGEAAAG